MVEPVTIIEFSELTEKEKEIFREENPDEDIEDNQLLLIPAKEYKILTGKR